MTHTLYFATTNQAKLAQLRWIAGHLGSDVCIIAAAERFGEAVRYDEIGETELEIARQGALAVAVRIGVPVLAEDTGLYVDALGGQPGVRAGHYLKQQGRQDILDRLGGVSDRRAEIVSAVAYAAPGGDVSTWVHRVAGQVIDVERWTPGLPNWIAPTPDNPLGGGYNAIFVPVGETRTLAEIQPVEAVDWGYREPNFIALLRKLGVA
ncbi:MAG: non-canonical purine NTP pyrophosphatase [Anaerolineae bacterium]|nr:non-canonical purine NTP pyrophosphatase [Anaerolineae bacterium]